MSARALIIVLVVLATACGGYGAYWWWSVQLLTDSLERWRLTQEARGYRILFRAPEISGFPASLTVRLETPEIMSPEGWRWAGPALSGTAAPWAPLDIAFSAPGKHLLVLPGLNGDSAEADVYDIDVGRADGRLLLAANGQPRRVALDLSGLSVRGDRVTEFHAEHIRASAGPLRLATPDQPQTLDISIKLSEMRLPAEMRTAFGRVIAQAMVTGTWQGPIPIESSPDALRQWRAADGRLLLHDVGLNWGPLDFDGRGELTVDEFLRPEGRLSGALAGYNEAIDLLRDQRLIASNAAAGSKLLLAALSQTDERSGRRIVELPVTFRDGRFFLGPIALFPLAPLL